MAVSVKTAAERLQVGEHRVRALIISGVLRAELISGRYIIDEHSLDAVEASSRPANIRSLSRRVAWAAASLADGQRPGWLSQPELSRLRKRLNASSADPAAWRARMRRRAASTTAYRAGHQALGSLRHDQRTVVTGALATNLVTDRHVESSSIQLWCRSASDRNEIVAGYGLLPSTQGNVTLRVVEVQGLTRLGRDGDAFRLIVAADLLDGDDSRSHSAGRALLEATLRERRWADLS